MLVRVTVSIPQRGGYDESDPPDGSAVGWWWKPWLMAFEQRGRTYSSHRPL